MKQENLPEESIRKKGPSYGGVLGLAVAAVALMYSACGQCKKEEPVMYEEVLPGYASMESQKEFYRLTRTVARELSAEGHHGINRTELQLIKSHIDDMTESPGVTMDEIDMAKGLHEALVARLQKGTAHGYNTQREIMENRGPEALFPTEMPSVHVQRNYARRRI
jgi:hypothetical protein